jgi:hypothetical protein
MTKFLKRTLLAASFGAIALFAGSCGSNNEKAPDVSGIHLSLKTSRFDVDLYALDTNHLSSGLQQLKGKYPNFLDYFLDTLMAYNIHGNYNDTVAGIREGLKPFLSFKDFAQLEDTIKKHYPNTTHLDEELTQAFKNIKYYYPSFPIPSVIYVNLGLSKWPCFPLDTGTLCIALDMFLGDQFPYYRSVGVPDYMGAHLRESYVPVSAFSAIYRGMYPFKPDDKTLLDLMIQRGKEQYFLHKIFPGKPDSVIFGYTQRQVDWCNSNEALVYNFFIHQNLLFNKDIHSITPYVTEGPFAVGLESPSNPVKNTPGNVGSWLGYRIVRSYMEQHPKVTLAQLLNMPTDAPQFLNEAKYKPK